MLLHKLPPSWFDPEVNAIYIATPPSSHATYAIMSMKAGKPAYIEKPMAVTYEDATMLMAAAMMVSLVACAGDNGENSETPVSSGNDVVEETEANHITLAESWGFENFYTIMTPDVSASNFGITYYLSNFYDVLVEYQDGEYVGGLAEDWTISEDGTVYTCLLYTSPFMFLWGADACPSGKKDGSAAFFTLVYDGHGIGAFSYTHLIGLHIAVRFVFAQVHIIGVRGGGARHKVPHFQKCYGKRINARPFQLSLIHI